MVIGGAPLLGHSRVPLIVIILNGSISAKVVFWFLQWGGEETERVWPILKDVSGHNLRGLKTEAGKFFLSPPLEGIDKVLSADGWW